jgi:F0F1-type ATP synthase membrane subunit c/vacuolar-type H+-ATPase subunit K
MTELIPFIYYISTGLLITLPVIGVGIGQGIANKALLEAIDQQPASAPHLKRLFVLIMASLETSVILPALMCIPLLTMYPSNIYSAFSLFGIVIALAIPGMVVGFAAALQSQAAVKAVARNPHVERSVMNILLITLSIIQTPIIFGLIIGWFQILQVSKIETAAHMLQILGSGIALGI